MLKEISNQLSTKIDCMQ